LVRRERRSRREEECKGIIVKTGKKGGKYVAFPPSVSLFFLRFLRAAAWLLIKSRQGDMVVKVLVSFFPFVSVGEEDARGKEKSE